MVDPASDKRLFTPDSGGYVLLPADTWGCPDDQISAVRNAGLIPIVRFDYRFGSQAVPVTQESIGPWIEAFTQCIDRHSDDATVFIVGNEPWNDGQILSEQYAAAYAALWKNVHGEDGTQRSHVALLVAGQGPHQ